MKIRPAVLISLFCCLLIGIAVTAQAGNGDYGDAPESYANAFHSQPGIEWLGAAGTPSVTREDSPNRVNLDPLDDGLAADGRVTLSLAAEAPPGVRFLNAWVDLNDDGRWSAAEHVVIDNALTIQPGASTGIALPVLDEAYGVHWIRVTVTREAVGVGSDGTVNAEFGETEDYPGRRGAGPPTTATPSPTPTPTATVYDPVPPSPEPIDPVPPSPEPTDPPPVDPRCEEEVALWQELLDFAYFFGGSLGALRYGMTSTEWLNAVPPEGVAAVDAHLSDLPDDAALSDALMADILKIVEETWITRQDAVEATATPSEDTVRVSERYDYQVQLPVRPIENSNYDEIRLNDGEVYIQPILRAENAVGIGETLDCAAYGTRFFERSRLTPDGQFEPITINGVPFCRYLIVGNGFLQWEMAFWHPSLRQPFGMSLIAVLPQDLLRILFFWFFQAGFTPL
ncbi:MAG: GEVED domain-containing protein [Anaerolineae bacterium]|nr:GEVED domain-containing protein [Anaerolineae bacterium]NUQ06402.1 hypothetical protein [Anaerolineae bacterium]